MKNYFAAFLAFCALLLSSCTNENPGFDSGVNDNQRSEKVRWYGSKQVTDNTTRGVADGTKRWNQDAGIYIKFINQPAGGVSVDRIKSIASEWERYAGIKFHYVEDNRNADVRIAFDWNGNDWLTWSYTGNDAKSVTDQNEPTAVFGGLRYLSQEQFRGDVLRLYGQILGLAYEQRHQNFDGIQNVDSIQAYWQNQFEGYNMDWDLIRELVFEPLTNSNVNQLLQTDQVDKLSVMAWPYYVETEMLNLEANYTLSQSDKEFIARLYPKSNEQTLLTIQEAWVDAGYFRWTYGDLRIHLTMTDLGRQQEFLPDVSDGEQLTSLYYTFAQADKLRRVPKFNSSNVTNFDGAFWRCFALTDVPYFDTTSGRIFSNMFYACRSLASVPQFDTGNGRSFNGMFSGCSSLVTVPLLTTSSGVDFSSMFSGCTSLTSVPQFDTANGTRFANMFYNCRSLKSRPDLVMQPGANTAGMFVGTPFI